MYLNSQPCVLGIIFKARLYVLETGSNFVNIALPLTNTQTNLWPNVPRLINLKQTGAI